MKLHPAVLPALLLAGCQSISPTAGPLEGPKITARVEPWAASESYLVIVEIEDPEHPGSIEHLKMPRTVVGAGQQAQLEMHAEGGDPIARARVTIPDKGSRNQSALVQVEWLETGTSRVSAPVRVSLPQPPSEGPDPRRFSATFENQDVHDAIEHIARRSGVNVIMSPDVQGTITLALENETWQGALESIAAAVGCEVVFETTNIARLAPQGAHP